MDELRLETEPKGFSFVLRDTPSETTNVAGRPALLMAACRNALAQLSQLPRFREGALEEARESLTRVLDYYSNLEESGDAPMETVSATLCGFVEQEPVDLELD